MVIAQHKESVILRQLRQESETSCVKYGISICTRYCDEICKERQSRVPCLILSFVRLLGHERVTAISHDFIIVPIFV
jgi:hypothetical protein